MKEGFKTTPIGELPIDWDIKSIDDVILNFQNGNAFSAKGYSISGFPIISIANISLDGKFKFDYTKCNRWDNSKAEGLTNFRVVKGDIIIAMTDVTPTKNLIGRMATVDKDDIFLLNQRVGLLKINKNLIDSAYLKVIGNSESWIKNCKANASLGVQANLSTKDIKKALIPLPPLPEQEKIAEILTTVDEKITVIDEQIGQAQELKKGLMQRLFTKGIGHIKFKPSLLGDIPENWEVVEFEILLSDHKNPLCYGILQPIEAEQDGVPMLRTVDLAEVGRANTKILKVTKENSAQSSKTVLDGGEILLSVMGTLGRTVVVPNEWKGWNVNRALAVIRLNENVINQYLCHYFRSPIFQALIQKQSLGSAQMRINLNDLRKYRVPLPPKSEQKKIAETLSTLDEKLEVLQEKKERYQEMKKGLMQQLLTGKLRVNHLIEEPELA